MYIKQLFEMYYTIHGVIGNNNYIIIYYRVFKF